MTAARHKRIKDIFLEACDLPPAQRGAFLDGACGSDARLRASVEQMLAGDSDPVGFERGVALRTYIEEIIGSGESAAPPDGTELLDHPQQIGGYRIIDVLGEGGFGTVFRAEQATPVRRTVALKVLKRGMDTRQVILRFNAERQALAMLDHPSFSRIFDAGETESGQPYFAMELVPGEPITRYCDANRLSTRERLELFVRVCSAVQHAHQKGLIHRDIKPSNVLIVLQEGQASPKLIDFGIARAIDNSSGGRTILTEAGQLIGTPEYMSPEQAAGSADIDTRTDIYSLGVILFELLAGRLPYDMRGLPLVDAARIIRDEEPARLTAISRREGGRYDRDIQTIVSMALDKDPSRRYPSAAELAADVGRYLRDEPLSAHPPSAAYQLRKFSRRHRAALAAGGGMLVLLIGGTVGTSVGMFRAIAARDAEATQRQRADVQTQTAREITEFLTKDLLGAATPFTKGKDVSVRQVVDEAAARIEGRFPDQPLVEAGVREALGRTYSRMALYEQAETHLAKAHEIRSRHMGSEAPETLDVKRELAIQRLESGRYAEAEALLTALLESDRVQRGADDERVVLDLHYLGRIYRRLDRSAEAERMFREALDIQTRRHGPDHDNTIATQGELAGFLRSIGRLEEAAPLIQRTLESQTRARGADDAFTLATRHNLATLYQQLNRLEDSEAMYKELIPAMQRAFGAEHPNVLTVTGGLGLVYYKQGRFEDAERTYADQIAGLKRALGEENINTLVAVEHLVELYMRQERWPEAESHCRDVLAIRERTLGPDHKQTSATRFRMARVYLGQACLSEAEPLFLHLLEEHRRKQEPVLAEVVVAYARGLIRAARHAEAEPLLREALDVRNKLTPDGSAEVAQVMGELGELLLNQARAGEAEPVLRAALEMNEQLFPIAQPSSITYSTNLATSLAMLGRLPEAREAAEQSANMAQRLLPDSHPVRVQAESVLAEIQTRLNNR
ncbi:MAG: tetratricopeptide repeat protein [Phycisphaerae bacterium]